MGFLDSLGSIITKVGRGIGQVLESPVGGALGQLGVEVLRERIFRDSIQSGKPPRVLSGGVPLPSGSILGSVGTPPFVGSPAPALFSPPALTPPAMPVNGGATMANFPVLPGGSPAIPQGFLSLGGGLQVGGGDAPALFRAGAPGTVRAVRSFMVMNPMTGNPVWFKNVGRPILFSGELAACKRVEKVARRARRASPRRTTRRTTRRR